MQPIRALLEKVLQMAEEVDDLDGQTDHYYERDIIDRLRAGEEIGIAECVEAITYLRELLNSQEAKS